jgi:hypothetical protein
VSRSQKRKVATIGATGMAEDRGIRTGARAVLALLLLTFVWLCTQSLVSAEVITGGNYRVRFSGSMTPAKLPRVGSRPISVSVSGAVQHLAGPPSPALREFTVSINRHAHLSLRGLPVCPGRLLKGDSTSQALARCRDALVGSGHFTAHIDLPEQAPFPAAGRLLVFNSRYRGGGALLGHVYGSQPVPTALDMYFRLHRERKGPFGLTLTATMPDVGEEWGYVTGFEVRLGRRYLFHDRWRSLLAAGCPAPAGFNSAPFKLARGVFRLADGSTRSRILSGVCHVTASRE